MKSFALASVVAPLLIAATIANAADVAAPAYKAPAPVPATTWTGPYLGVTGGYAWHDRAARVAPADPATLLGFGPSVRNASHDLDGGLFGFQLGYNWQFDPRWVAGLEADFQFGALKDTATSPFTAVIGAIPGTLTLTDEVKWFGTLRARLGVLLTPDLLVYGTGGLAYGRVGTTVDYVATGGFGAASGAFAFNCNANTLCFSGHSSRMQAGWTLGGGAEWTLWKNVAFKAEYLYVNLGGDSLPMTALTGGGGLTPASFNVILDDAEFHLLRGGLNVRF